MKSFFGKLFAFKGDAQVAEAAGITVLKTLQIGARAIRICAGDLTLEATEAVVNAANGDLQHGSGVAGALRRACGEQMLAESEQWVKEHGKVPTGECAHTSGGLKAYTVIHAVGPVYKPSLHEQSVDALVSAVKCSLDTASELRLRSVALPAISSGIFGFPKNLCAQLMLDTAIEFCVENEASSVEEIHFTNIDQETCDIFCAEVVGRFGDAPTVRYEAKD